MLMPGEDQRKHSGRKKRRRGRPGSRIPEAIHSMTRRRASPGPSGRLQVAMAFSQISSRGCGREQREETLDTRAKTFATQNPEAFPAGNVPILGEAATGGVCCTCLGKSSGPPRTTSGPSLWPDRQDAGEYHQSSEEMA